MNIKPPDEESRSENTEGAFPEHLSKIGIPFDDAYALVQQMYDVKAK